MLWSVVREALWLVVAGFVVGDPIVFLGGDLASTLFFGVSPRDWSIFLAATATLLIVGVICSFFPALRAARVEPAIALRQELSRFKGSRVQRFRGSGVQNLRA